jgi:hypothetical protein
LQFYFSTGNIFYSVLHTGGVVAKSFKACLEQGYLLHNKRYMYTFVLAGIPFIYIGNQIETSHSCDRELTPYMTDTHFYATELGLVTKLTLTLSFSASCQSENKNFI